MSQGLATLSINLEARLAELQQGFDKAARLAEKNAADVQARYNRLASVATGIGATLAGAFSSVALVQFFRSTVDGLDALNDLADATGASIENLSALEDIAARTGTSIDTVGSALVRFNAELSAAKEGSQTAEILRRIGLSAEELRRLDPAEALRRTAVELARFADDGDKARAVQALFGKSVAEVAPLLKDLAEAGRLNATVTTEQAKEAERFNRQLSELGKNVIDSARVITSDLVPALNSLLEKFTSLSRFKLLNVGDTLEVLAEQTLFEPAESAAFYAKQLENLQRQFQIVATTTEGVARRGGLIDLAGEIERVQKLRDLFRQFAQQDLPQASYSNEGRPRTFGGLPDPDKPGGNKPKPTDFAGTILDPLTAAAIKRLQDTEAAKLGQLRLELQALIELGGDTDVGNQGAALKALRDEIAKLDPEQQKLAASRQRLNELLANTPTGQLQSVLSDIELLNAEYARSPKLVEQWAEAVRAVTARLPKETERALEELSEFTKQFQSNVQNVLGDNIADILQGNFDDIEGAWKRMLLGMIAQATAADLAKRLFGADGRGGYLAELFGGIGFAKGGAFNTSGQPITAFADGGVLTRPSYFGMGGGRMGVAGEAGPEGILPLRRGPGGRLGVEAYGGGGGTNLTINVAAGMTRGETIAAIQLGMQQVEGKIMSNLRNGRVI
jgi:hypothetical protein